MKKKKKSYRDEICKAPAKLPQENALSERDRIMCVIRTRLAYCLADVANSLLIDAETTYKRVGIGLKAEERQKFKYMAELAKRLKYAAKDATKTMYELDINAYYEDSDNIQDLMLLICDRCGGEEETFKKVRNMVANRFKSRMQVYD